MIKAGGYKVRANDTDYNYRPDSAFVYYSGVQGSDATADAVLVLEPSGDSHLTYLYMNPRSTRDTDAFYRDVKYGEISCFYLVSLLRFSEREATTNPKLTILNITIESIGIASRSRIDVEIG